MAQRSHEPGSNEPGSTEPVGLEPLVGRRVRLREVRDDEVGRLAAWWNDPRVGTYMSSLHQPRSADAIAEMIRGWSQNDGSRCGLAIVTKDSDNLIGQCALYGVSAKDRCATFAMLLGPEHQDQGFGSDAIEVAVRFGFHELGLHRIELGVYGFNHRAIAAYRKAGFVEEGRRRQAMYRSGGWHDNVLMGMLRAEWESRRGETTPQS